jgi:hypothetical protein
VDGTVGYYCPGGVVGFQIFKFSNFQIIKTVKVLQGQSIFDIAIQELGSAEGAFDLAVLNGISITDELTPGQELALPTVVNKQIASYYANKGLKPATALTLTNMPAALGGIDYWAIETAFMVS